MSRITALIFIIVLTTMAVVTSLWVKISVMPTAHAAGAQGLPPPADMPIDIGSAPPPLPPPPPPLPPGVAPSKAADQTEPAMINPQTIDPTLKFGNNEGFQYDPSGRRDPFKPFLQKEPPPTTILGDIKGPVAAPSAPKVVEQPKDDPRLLDTLIGHDVGQYKLLGVLWDVKDPKAMVKSPVGRVFLVKKQTRIGYNNGYVAAIREGEIVVIELDRLTKSPNSRVISLTK